MTKKIKIGDEVRLKKAGIKRRQKEFPGFKPSATTGFVTGPGFKDNEVIVAISDGELNSLLMDDLEVIKAAPKGFKPPDSPNIKSVDDLTNNLHGSGIDYDWEIEETNTSYRASNAFHTMNQDGEYDSVVSFTIIFPKRVSIRDFKLQFAGDSHSQYQVQKYMLRDYLEDMITFAIMDME